MASASADWLIETIDRQRLLGTILGGDAEVLRVIHPTLGELSISLDALRRVRRIKSGDAALLDAGEYTTGNCAKSVVDGDTVELANGDALHGTIDRVDAESLTVASQGQSRAAPWGVVREVRFEANAPESKGGSVSVLLRLTDGSTLRATRLDWKSAQVEADVLDGKRVRLSPEQVRAVEVLGGRRTWLSDLKPSAYSHRPILGATYEAVSDANVVGGPLSCAGRRYDRGVGLHSPCRVEYPLSRRFRRFRADVGIDDSAGSLADVRLRVIVAGRTIAEIAGLRFRRPPRSIDADVKDAESLVIEIDAGRNADVQGRVDLLDAALIAD